jgi:hypothetical protein
LEHREHIAVHNTEDKNWWVVAGGKQEIVFVEQICPNLKIDGKINPAKQHDPYAPDLVVNGQLADLKCQRTPFFKAQALHNVDPQFAVTFNHKDYVRYRRLYPGIVIYFWVDWKELEKIVRGIKYTVQPMLGVWRVPFTNLATRIEQNLSDSHTYQRRITDTQGNARESYVFDIRGFECLFQQGPE